MKSKYLLFVALICALVLSACSGGFKAETNWKVKEFTYVNHRGENVSLNDLEGKVWLADFIFTNCTTVCLPMTSNMVSIQEKLEEEGVENYNIVSFSVDPDMDTPEVLEDYLAAYNPTDESKWHLLTGYSMKEITELANKSFKTVVLDDPNSNQVIHGTAFYLVDQNGTVVKSYDGVSNVTVDEIVADMKLLTEQQSP